MWSSVKLPKGIKLSGLVYTPAGPQWVRRRAAPMHCTGR